VPRINKIEHSESAGEGGGLIPLEYLAECKSAHACGKTVRV
jgi:hypothetical protein